MIDGFVFAGDNIGSLELALHGRVRGALGMFADEFLAGQSVALLPILPCSVHACVKALVPQLAS